MLNKIHLVLDPKGQNQSMSLSDVKSVLVEGATTSQVPILGDDQLGVGLKILMNTIGIKEGKAKKLTENEQ